MVYQQAFDIYHCMFRILSILDYFERGDSIEVDRLRIWDYFMLFPNKMTKIKLKRGVEDDIKTLIENYILKEDNPYEIVPNDRILFEKIKPFQMTALNCLSSYNIINKDALTLDRVLIDDKAQLKEKIVNLPKLEGNELNALKLLTSHFYLMPLFGEYGLKFRTGLLESKYDA